ncbi:MAG: trigger factor [Lachnospiraceae bacterium]|nr:trigger factor [Lachnospiraceae bacterium]
MKKKILAAGLILAMAAGIVGCGKKSAKVELCEYRGIALQAVSEEKIDEKIDEYVANYFYRMDEVEDPIQKGDTTYINFVGKLDGVPFEGGTNETDTGYPLVIGSGSFIEGFEDGLIGMKKGEAKVLDISFPETYDPNPDLAGKAVTFDVSVIKVTRKVDLELNDENVQSIMKYDTVQAFRDAVKKDLCDESYKDQIAEYLIAQCKVENLPEDEVEKYANKVYNMARQEIYQYSQMYGVTEEQILSALLRFNTFEELLEYCKEGAKQNVAYQLIIEEIAKKEKIKVTEDIFSTKGLEVAKKFGYSSVDELVTAADGDRSVVEDEITMEITLDFLIENAKIF